MANTTAPAPAQVYYPVAGDGDFVTNFVGYDSIQERILYKQIVAKSDIPGDKPNTHLTFRAAIAYTNPSPKKVMWVMLLAVGPDWKAVKPIGETGRVKCVEDVVDVFLNELEVQFAKVTGKPVGFKNTSNLLDEVARAIEATPGAKLPHRSEVDNAAANNKATGQKTAAPPPPIPDKPNGAETPDTEKKGPPVKSEAPAVVVRGDGSGKMEIVSTGMAIRASRWLRTAGNVLLNIETGAKIYIGTDNQVWFSLAGDYEVLSTTKNWKEADTILCQIAASLVAPPLDMQFELQ